MKKHHPRNLHINGYDLERLSLNNPQLKQLVVNNVKGGLTLDFSDAKAVKALNQALLIEDYKLAVWDIPDTNLCPAVPGRADLIHALADLLASHNNGQVPVGKNTHLLDIGTGASLIYPILAHQIYGWKATATDIDNHSVKQAKNLANFNKLPVKLKLQRNSKHIFKGVINPDDYYHITCCNPPFHSSLDKAHQANQRKWRNLDKDKNAGLNFSGQKAELWCEGGELRFLLTMISESEQYKSNVGIFTSLVSKKQNLTPLTKQLKKLDNCHFHTVPLAHGQKVMNLLCWQFD
jgi:23S rRNA (adenine1618-N6)-methyltransferase